MTNKQKVLKSWISSFGIGSLKKLDKSKRRKKIAGIFLWVKSFKTRLGTKKILKFNGLSWTFCSSCVGKNVLSARAVCFSARVHYGTNFYFCPKIMSHFFILEILLSHSTSRSCIKWIKSNNKEQSINYVISKLAIFDPLLPLVVFFIK